MDAAPRRSDAAAVALSGMLGFTGRPRWRTVTGGSRRYVDELTRPFADRIRTFGYTHATKAGISVALKDMISPPKKKDLLEAANEAYGAGNYSVLVTADHGGHGRGHGSKDPLDVTIPWIAWGRGVSAGAMVMESPVCTPIGSIFSIEQMMMQLSRLSRTTSISNSFQPSTDSSISTSLVGEASRPRSTISRNSALL